MFNIPILTRAFAGIILAVGIWLAGENTLISAEVLGSQSGASVVSSTAIAVVATGLEIVFASWFIKEDSLGALYAEIRKNHAPLLSRLFLAGTGLFFVYHFDILTTSLHPQFVTDNRYFFWAVVGAFIFGPEACIMVSWWIWGKARDVETQQLKKNNHKDGENAFMKAHREQLTRLGREAGVAKATEQASQRWGNVPIDS